MPRRVRRNAAQESIYKALNDGESHVFDTFKDVFMMAACVGFKMGVKEHFEKQAEPIDLSVFKKVDQQTINAIALLETGDINILVDDDDTWDRKLQIVEEYANAGIEILKNRLLDAPGYALDNMLSMIGEQANDEDSDDEGALSKLVDTLFI